ncbi:eggshell protein 2A [Amborella trichopoda]|uniref:Glycine-rich protein n=1 Tax=Amborella trichopoda TaxID=13333 RepID=W1P0R0_AMBTC|nr:eggshell protein 2A [Amborella trichopoda]ERN03427.1 hypothetical protein AMTR_s00003p00261880 [Amborella trichopoda]|eukprot:XP_006841752.1 eggshell protein 2A [Amborella trichopoda]
MKTICGVSTAVLLVLAVLAASTLSRAFADVFSDELKKNPGQKRAGNPDPGDFGIPGMGGGFGIPGIGSGWGNGIIGGGYGGGFGGPNGGYSKGGIYRPTVVCSAPGPCYKKKLVCPAKCFKSFSKSGKNYGSGGGGGGCTMDCKKKCVAYC